ncbi:protein KTI12, partial [Lecanoromycetidae sp. Uapishka_2]
MRPAHNESSDARISRLAVYHINAQALSLSREVYREARIEKDARATEYSTVKRALGKDSIVVADGLNYIKGFRYQLYCEAKAVQTPSCVTPVTESDYLYELDKATQEITNLILDWQKDHPSEGGGELALTGGTIDLPANQVSLPQLQRLRRQFISLNRQHNLPKHRIWSSFIEYLNDCFG